MCPVELQLSEEEVIFKREKREQMQQAAEQRANMQALSQSYSQTVKAPEEGSSAEKIDNAEE
jgi:hypothetical protein